MRDTNSALDGSIGAPTVAATFLLGTMREANSALDSLIRPKTYFTIDSETSCTYFLVLILAPPSQDQNVRYRVASHLCTGGLAGIGKLPAIVDWYIRYGITAYNIFLPVA